MQILRIKLQWFIIIIIITAKVLCSVAKSLLFSWTKYRNKGYFLRYTVIENLKILLPPHKLIWLPYWYHWWRDVWKKQHRGFEWVGVHTVFHKNLWIIVYNTHVCSWIRVHTQSDNTVLKKEEAYQNPKKERCPKSDYFYCNKIQNVLGSMAYVFYVIIATVKK